MIICGDALTELRKLPDEFVQMILTDIPYGEVNQESAGLRRLNRGDADYCEINLGELADQCVRVMLGSVYIFCGTQQISRLITSFRNHGLTTRVGVWEKTNPSPMNGDRLWLSGLEFCVFSRKPGAVFNEYCKKAIWRFPSIHSQDHPTEKPTELLEKLILASSMRGQTVLDCCMGSGTTGIAARRLGRGFIGIELNPKYCEMAKKRIYGELMA